MNDRSFIETQFPIARLSAESYKERKANLGQTLTRLGKWWGRKPLVLVRASILGMLMPASDDPKRDRDVFLKLMTMDDDGVWRRRKGKLPDAAMLAEASQHAAEWKMADEERREELRISIWDELSPSARVRLDQKRRFAYSRTQFEAQPYDQRIRHCVRPEQIEGTVLLVLRKRVVAEHGFLDEVYPLVEDEVHRQIDSMRALDENSEPNFGDTDYQLAAYAAALRVLTQYQTLDGQDVGHELFRVREPVRGRGRRAVATEKSRFEQVIDRGIEIACLYLVPRGLDAVWASLTGDERLYLRALDVESRGERRQGVYQELARGFGVREVKSLLQSSTANSTRVRTASEFGRRDLGGDGFAGTRLRQLLFAIHTTRAEEAPEAGHRFLKDELKEAYWPQRQRMTVLLDWLATLRQADAMTHWIEDSEAARLLAGRLRGDHA